MQLEQMVGLFLMAYVGGIFTFLSPCIFPVIPVYMSLLSIEGKVSVKKTLLFVLGLSLTFLILGLGIGYLGQYLFNDWVRIAGGVFVIVMGLFQLDVLKLAWLERTKKWSIQEAIGSEWEPFLVGLTFSLGWTPCMGPMVASILLVSGLSGSMGISVLTMLIYVLGLATPFVMFSLMSQSLWHRFKGIRRHLHTMKRVGGVLLVGMGIILMTNQLGRFIPTVNQSSFLSEEKVLHILGEARQGDPVTRSVEASTIPKEHSSAALSLASVVLYDREGHPYRFGKDIHKKVYVKLWASWCHICLHGLPELEEMSRNPETSYDVVTIVFPGRFGEKSEQDFAAWFQKQGYSHIKVLYDPSGIVANQVHLRVFPTSLWVDETGHIQQVLPGHLSKDMIDKIMQVQ